MLNKLHALLADKGFVCPFATKAEKEDQNVKTLYQILGDTSDHSIAHNPLVQAAKIFVKKKKESLVCLLDETYTIPENSYANRLQCAQAAQELEKRLLYCLGDVVHSIMLAEFPKKADFTKIYEEHGYPRTDVGGHYKPVKRTPLSSDTDAFRQYFHDMYMANYSTDATYIRTCPPGKNAAENKYLALFMGPMYTSNHPRYAPYSMIVVNNFEHLSNIGLEKRNALGDAIVTEAEKHGIRYQPHFFSTPVPQYYMDDSNLVF